MPSFDPHQDIPNLNGKVVFVTGGNSGLGFATIACLATHQPKTIYMACRSLSKAKDAIERLRETISASIDNVIPLQLDLASLDSVKKAAYEFLSKEKRLDLLYLNAGIGAPPHATTTDGYEIQFQSNFLGHALLTQLLLPCLLATAGQSGSNVRVVALSSVGHKSFAPSSGIQFDKLKSDMASFSGMALYGQSMLARTLYAYELSKKYPSLTITSGHPGTVRTNITSGEKSSWLAQWRFKILMVTSGVSAEEGAKNQLWMGFDNSVQSGKYYEPIGKEAAGKHSYDDAWASSLYNWTQKELDSYM